MTRQPARPARAGLTLIELLVSAGLAALLVASATAAFMQIRTLARRVEIRQQLHSSARTVYERMRWELSSLMHGSAFFAIGHPQDAGGAPGNVELVFLRGKADNVDFMTGSSFGAEADALTDLVWSRWCWDSTRMHLLLSASSPVRNLGARYYWPNPQRTVWQPAVPGTATADVQLANTLNANAQGTTSPRDVGDYQNLLDNATVIAANCSDFAMEVVCRDGVARPITSRTAAMTSWVCDGMRTDGWTGTGSPLDDRPRLIRIRFTLTEPASPIDGKLPDNLVSETFSFSFLLPAMSPG